MKMRKMHRVLGGVLLLGLLCVPRAASAAAGTFEVSSGFSFTRSQYGDARDNWVRRWGASVGYHLTELSEIEFGFQDVFDRTKITGFEDTSFHDQIFSANWVQAFLGKAYAVQPYVKIGIGQLNRDASGIYTAFGTLPPAQIDAVTGILGAGFRIYLTRTFGLRGEVNSYLTGGSIRTWRDNVGATLGLSVFL